jgi:signal transduction histidine kinase
MKFRTVLLSFVLPKSSNEDARRREFILNILLLATITLLTIAMVSSLVASISESVATHANDAMPVVVIAVILSFFAGLYALSRFGFVKTSSFIFVTIFFILALYFAYQWGPDVTIAVEFYALTIVMAGVLLNSRMAFGVAVSYGFLIPALNYLQTIGSMPMNSYWRTEHFIFLDAIILSTVLIIVATVSWLSNRETEQALVRVQRSEAALKVERDMLEVRVRERTDELQLVQMEKMSQTYHFVEFGRLASGLFHDLINPLTSLSMNIENIALMRGNSNEEKLKLLVEDVTHAQNTTFHIQRLMESMRRHLIHESVQEKFSVEQLIHNTVRILTSYARLHEVQLLVMESPDVLVFGDPIAFAQVLTNILSNGVESFSKEDLALRPEKTVTIKTFPKSGGVTIKISDNGPGMSKETLDKIFEPFFSTKGPAGGLGIGLSLAKRIVEKRFGGILSAVSEIGTGTTFTIYLPLREP